MLNDENFLAVIQLYRTYFVALTREKERSEKNSFIAGISYCEGKKGGAQQVNRDNERPRRHTGRDRFRA